MIKEYCGTNELHVRPTLRNWRIRYFKRLTIPLIPFIQEGIRCTKTSRQHIGGMEWREKLPSMLPFFVTYVRESWSSIDDLLDCCNLCKYPSGSGNKLSGILSWHCLGLSLENDSLGVIVDRLAKVAHFVPANMTYTGPQLAELYNSRIVYFHGVPMRIVPSIGTQFILKCWEMSL
jgi:hypothetical protein